MESLVDPAVDLVEWYYGQGYSDGLPVVPPTPEKIAAMLDKGFDERDSTVFALAAEPPHSVTSHVANDAEGILDSLVSAMSTIPHNNAVSSGHCAVVLDLEHARTIAAHGWRRADLRTYLWMNAGNRFGNLAFEHRYGPAHHRNLPVWYKRELDGRTPIVPSPDHIQVAGGEVGRFSTFIPGWRHMSNPVPRGIDGAAPVKGPACVGGICHL
jgi:hypothetical protein